MHKHYSQIFTGLTFHLRMKTFVCLDQPLARKQLWATSIDVIGRYLHTSSVYNHNFTWKLPKIETVSTLLALGEGGEWMTKFNGIFEQQTARSVLSI